MGRAVVEGGPVVLEGPGGLRVPAEGQLQLPWRVEAEPWPER